MNKVYEEILYECIQYGIKMYYKSNWSLKDNVQNVVAILTMIETASENPNELSDGSSKVSLTQKDFIPSINITYQNLMFHPMSLEMYVNSNIQQMKSILSDFELLTSEESELSGNPAIRVTFSGKFQGLHDLKFIQMVTIKDKKVYATTYTASKSSFDNYVCDFESIIKSFEIQ